MRNEILNFCMEKGFLVDNDFLELFSETSDVESVKMIIERVKTYTHQNVLTKNLFEKNKEQVNKFFLDLPEDKKRNLEKLRVKLGLSIEISKERCSENFKEDNLETPLKIEIVRARDAEASKFVLDEETFKSDLNAEAEKFNLNRNPGKNRFEKNVNILSYTPKQKGKPEVKDFTAHFRNRFSALSEILQARFELDNLLSIDKISGYKQGVSIIGMVYKKTATKNKNIILEVEDLTGRAKILVSKSKEDLYKIAEEICLDSVLGFRCSGDKEFLFANGIFFPDSAVSERKKSSVDEYALFIGDLHFGSKLFLKDGFFKFLDYLNEKVGGGNTEEIKKIKYLFITGDVVTGVGNYPDQEKDLEVADLEEQFIGFAKLLEKIPKHIKIIISPGNHDGVRIMEPQPVFDLKYAWPLYNLENVIITENPCLLNFGAQEDFVGFDVLTYHGFSYPYYAGNIPELIKKKAMNSPEEIMKYLLKHRHLAPTHGSTQYFPHKEDSLIIKNVPDIFVSGHTHKCGVSYYNNILIISTSCWEAMTPYQEKFGNEPDHCKVPMLNLKTRAVKILDFEGK